MTDEFDATDLSPYVHTSDVNAEQTVYGNPLGKVVIDGEERQVVVNSRHTPVVIRGVPGARSPHEVHIDIEGATGAAVGLVELLRTVARVGDNLLANAKNDDLDQWESAKREAISQRSGSDDTREWGYALMPEYIEHMERVDETETDR